MSCCCCYQDWGITSLAVPPLGCGEGPLEWRVVAPTLYRHLNALDIPVELFAPFDTPHEELQAAFLEKRASEEASEPAPYRLPPGAVGLAAIVGLVEKASVDSWDTP